MSDTVPPTNTSREEVYRLANAVLSLEISDAEARRLEHLVVHDRAACQWYVEFMCDAYNLHARMKVGRRLSACDPLTAVPTVEEDDAAESPHTAALPPIGVPFVGVRSSDNYSSWGRPIVYSAAIALIAIITFGIGMMVGSVTYVPQLEQDIEPRVAQSQPLPEHETTPLGRITGMADCQWAGSGVQANRGDVVSLGRKIVLSSGLLEIAYDIGAKVILEGPAVYEVDSPNSGFLSSGKLTVKATTEKAKGFVIRTPTAIVTDLGTEFGVGVDKLGGTTSHTFRGLARLNVLTKSGEPENPGQLLRLVSRW